MMEWDSPNVADTPKSRYERANRNQRHTFFTW